MASYRELRAVREELAEAREMRDSESDPELRDMAREEVERLETREAALIEELRVQLAAHATRTTKDVIMEIRAGAGGEEAALFAAELFRMYARYAERHGWTIGDPDAPTRPASAACAR